MASILPFLSGTSHADDVEPLIDFTRDVRPILSRHCFACHGPDVEARKADLSLLDYESATRPLAPGVHAIVPGEPDSSELWLRINDREDPMPPEAAHKPLDPDQIEILRRWIESGASYEPHWAYRPPVRIESGREDASDRYDQLVLDRLESAGIAPSGSADPVTLMRRVTLDLTGLPPTSSEVDAYLAADPETRYEALVDRLLARPHFGERLASHWLDLVRYADTVGYHGDQEHRVWPYRDWVIRSFNENLPFDTFTTHQLAGDLVPGAGQDELIASAYNRLLQTTHEGGLQLEEYRAIYMADRVRNASQVWMGATLGCAQCHDHKYDPFTAHDFHAFGAFFADIDDEEHLRDPYGGLNTSPTLRRPEMPVETDASRKRRAELALEMDASKAAVVEAVAALEPNRGSWEEALRRRVDAGENRVVTWVDDILETGGDTQGDWSFVREPDIEPASGERYRRQRSDGLVQHYTVDTTRRTIPVEAGQVLFAWVRLDPDAPPSALMLQCNTAGDWNHRAVWGNDDIPYGRAEASHPGYQRLGELPEPGRWHRLEVPFERIGLRPGDVVSGIAFTQFGGTVLWDLAGARSSGPAPPDVIDALLVVEPERTAEQRERLRAFQAAESEIVAALEARTSALEAERTSIVDTLPRTLYTKTLAEPREVRILPRGDWLDDSGALVEPAIPTFLGTIPGVEPGVRATRLDLARWLFLPESEGGSGGMTARVFVNRIWGLLFGEGLCPSVEDFGGQGRPPSNGPLLDMVALDFIEGGWDIKALVRSLVLTSTYRQSSMTTADLDRLDPENLLHARQTRHRMSAEMVRDAALKVSGLLVDRRGGPSVKPAQPAGYYRHLNFPVRSYMPDVDERQWRRGVYVHWQRQYLHPMLRAFDGPTREECTARRTESNTPLAALVLMNDPAFVEASRAFAQRLLELDGLTDEERIVFAMREAVARFPMEAEVALLMDLLERQRVIHAADPDATAALLAVGSSPRNPDLDPAEHAAWTHVTRTILNLHETITRE